MSEYEWELDKDVNQCRRCQQLFSLFIRRHHCRKCGQIICDHCSLNRVVLSCQEIVLPRIQDKAKVSLKPQRICDSCVEIFVVKNSTLDHNTLLECPVCSIKLLELETNYEQEQHVQNCLIQQQQSSVIKNFQFIAYTLDEKSTLIGRECMICLDEYAKDDKVTRLNCMCSYHNDCIHNWFLQGRLCPIHSH